MTATDALRIEKAIHFIEANFKNQPSLEEVAAYVNLSGFHFQRLFRRWAGISPKRFLQFLTAQHARRLLEESRSVLDVAFDVGMSGPGRLHDLTVNVHAMSPGELKRRGAGLTIHYGFHDTPFGECLIAQTDRGVCALFFVPSGGRGALVGELAARWRGATIEEMPESTGTTARKIFSSRRGNGRPDITLHVEGTNFQIRVWEALLTIPPGMLVSYSDVATLAGQPEAVRAAGTAVGQNPISYLIPCHRVIRRTGAIGRYRWGGAKKRALIGWEAAQRHLREEQFKLLEKGS